MGRTHFDAMSTADAIRGAHDELLLILDELRIVAPRALQRTALQKHRRANARPIFGRKLLNAADKSRRLPFRIQFQIETVETHEPAFVLC